MHANDNVNVHPHNLHKLIIKIIIYTITCFVSKIRVHKCQSTRPVILSSTQLSQCLTKHNYSIYLQSSN